jgi:hypothetical protein
LRTVPSLFAKNQQSLYVFAHRPQFVLSCSINTNPTNSEDIFIGFALANKGYRNIQLQDVYARSLEPAAGHMPRQVYMWSSSFLQSCYYRCLPVHRLTNSAPVNPYFYASYVLFFVEGLT